MIPPNDRVASSAFMKAQQSHKIGELRDTLFAAGFHTIQEQSDALGICRSTAWTIFKTLHKNSGLSAAIINQMLAGPQLPSAARTKILEYVDEKVAGRYGHSAAQRRKFIARISAELPPHGETLLHCGLETQHQKGPKNGDTKAPPLHPTLATIIYKQRQKISP